MHFLLSYFFIVVSSAKASQNPRGKLGVMVAKPPGKTWHYSTEKITTGTTYFAALKWQVSGRNLTLWKYLNGSIYSASTSDFKDFTGAMTAVGSYNWGTYQLNGDMEKFCYTKDALTDSQIAAIRASASSSVGFSYDTLGRLTEKTVNTGSAAKTTSYT